MNIPLELRALDGDPLADSLVLGIEHGLVKYKMLPDGKCAYKLTWKGKRYYRSLERLILKGGTHVHT